MESLPSSTASLEMETAGHPGCSVGRRVSTGSLRRRRCSLYVHLPRGKGGWPRPWCAWFSRARSFTKRHENCRSEQDRPHQRLYTVVKLSLALSLAILSLLPWTFPLASSCLSSSLRVARLIFFFSSPRALTQVPACICARGWNLTEAEMTIATLRSRASSTMGPVFRLNRPVIRGNQCLSTRYRCAR